MKKNKNSRFQPKMTPLKREMTEIRGLNFPSAGRRQSTPTTPVIFGNDRHRRPKTELIRRSLKTNPPAPPPRPKAPSTRSSSPRFTVCPELLMFYTSQVIQRACLSAVRQAPRGEKKERKKTRDKEKNGRDTAHLTLRAIVLGNNSAAIGFRRGVAPLIPHGTARRSGEKRVKGDPRGLMSFL